jgi:hypothetical protein
VDDEVPQVTIGDVTANEGDAGMTSATFTVSLSIAAAEQTTVQYATADGTATSTAGPDQDYQSASGTLTFGPGETSKTISVNVLGDVLSEASETFLVNLSNGSANVAIADNQGQATIQNEDAPPTMQIDNVTVGEGNGAPAVSITFAVTLSKIAGQTITVDYATAPGTARTPADFTAVSGTLTFAPGETSKTLPSVAVVGDVLIENDETVFMNLSHPNGATFADSKGQGTILDDDAGGTLEFSAPVFTVSERLAAGRVTVTRTGSLLGTVRVDYAMFNGTATAGADYTPKSGTLMFRPRVKALTFTVPIARDALLEPDESVLLTLANPTGGSTLGAQRTTALTIEDDEATFFSFTRTKYVTVEGKLLRIPVTRSGTTTNAATVDYQVSGGTADGADYAGASGTLAFGPKVRTQFLNLMLTDDTLVEDAETVVLSLTNPQSLDPTVGAKLGKYTSTETTIKDNEPMVQLAPIRVSARELAKTYTLFVIRNSVAGTTTVEYSLGGTATAGVDYLPPSAGPGPWTVTLPPGVSKAALVFTVIPDGDGEGAETIDVLLSNPTGASLGRNTSSTITIMDDEPLFQFASKAYTATESGGSSGLLVRRTSKLGTATVDYVVGAGTATSPGDFTLGGTGTLTFDPGVVVQTIPVSVVADALDEGSETVTVSLANPVGASLGTIPATALTINDDGPVLYFSQPTYTVSEKLAAVVLTVRRSGPTTLPATVRYEVTGGTAEDGSDFSGGAGLLSFGASQVVKPIKLSIVRDTIAEPPENIQISLVNDVFLSGASLGTQSTAEVVIDDNDSAGTFSLDSATYSVGETGPTAKITVIRTGGTAQDVMVHYGTSNGSAQDGPDYTSASGDLIFAAKDKKLTFEVPINDDFALEGDETLQVSLSAASAYGNSGDPHFHQAPPDFDIDSAMLTIVDDDSPGVISFGAPVFTVTESGAVGKVTVTRTGGAAGVTVHFGTVSGTASSVADADFAITSGDLAFPGGVTSMTFNVPITGDDVAEPNEWLSLQLSTPTGGATLGASSSTLWIIDDDQ